MRQRAGRNPHSTSGNDERTHVDYIHLHQTGAEQAVYLVSVEIYHADKTCNTTEWLPDSDAEADAMAEKDFLRLSPKPKVLLPEKHTTLAANGERLQPLGVFCCTVTLGSRRCSTVIHVFYNLKWSLFSRQSCVQLGLLDEGWRHLRVEQRLSA